MCEIHNNGVTVKILKNIQDEVFLAKLEKCHRQIEFKLLK